VHGLFAFLARATDTASYTPHGIVFDNYVAPAPTHRYGRHAPPATAEERDGVDIIFHWECLSGGSDEFLRLGSKTRKPTGNSERMLLVARRAAGES